MLKRLICSRVRANVRTMASKENRLASQMSPYLLQHKNNPVDWYPWGPEAIAEAKRQDKMIFLSIGYSTCHWCHVMERESFENPDTAAVMNDHYINVKVDREERPDVDKVYMTFVQASTGGGGWPLSLWLSPELFPVFGGTYFPPGGSFGRPGFTEVLLALSSQWQENRDEMRESGHQVMNIIDRKMGSGSLTPSVSLPSEGVFRKLYVKLSNSYDKEFGGYSKAPKFPQPSLLMTMFRLQSWQHEAGDRKKRGLEMNLHTLDMMNLGGIHDHVMNGFARYSTDKMWHVPHFEKMLYDQAQLAMAYSAAFSITKKDIYKDVIDDILLYVTRDMTHKSGGFFAAEDADSYPMGNDKEKKEGAFCVWSWEEIQSLLSEQVEGEASEITLAAIVAHEYNMKEGGNVDPRGDPHGELKNQNVLTKIPVKPLLIPDVDKYKAALAKANKILFDQRLLRPRPGLDIKIVTCWNALMISAFCKSGSATQNDKYISSATTAGNFLLNTLWNDDTKRLLRCVYGVKDEISNLAAPIEGFVDDYCMTVQALLDLYSATFDEIWLRQAVSVQKTQDDLFLDKDQGGYFTSREGDEQIVLRLKDDQDGAEPSSNSVSAMNLFRLGKILNSSSYTEQGEKIVKLYSERLEQLPHALPALVDAYLLHHQAEPMIVVTGDNDNNPVLKYLLTSHYPSHIVVKPGDLILASHPQLSSANLETSPGAYLFLDDKISPFVSSVEQFLETLDEFRKQ